MVDLPYSKCHHEGTIGTNKAIECCNEFDFSADRMAVPWKKVKEFPDNHILPTNLLQAAAQYTREQHILKGHA